ncbi:MAG: efflux RND transporter periplasmic adaptor subunit [Proteobacteria bacterium]|nr:efflux RND transporter periplasmic adaptor subunit [Pseudomonadota bacterium]
MSEELSRDLASLRIDRSAEEAPPRRWPGRLLLLALLAGAALGARTFVWPALSGRVFRTAVSVTEVLTMSPAEARVELTATGYVVPQRASRLTPQIEGRLAQVTVKEGDLVRAGQPLVRLEDADRRSALATARARVATAQARVRAAEATLAEAALKLRRQRALQQRGATPAAEVEDLAARVASLGAEVDAARADVSASRAQAEAQRVELDYMTIAAPISGTVVSKPAELGEWVGPSTPILELADLGTLEVEVDVPEARLQQVRAGAPCEIVLDAFPQRRERGEVVRVSPRLNRAKATATVKVRFVDPVSELRPEMAARVAFLRGAALDAASVQAPPKVIVPAAAVVRRGPAALVFVVDGDRVRLQPVQLGPAFGGGFELLAGPPSGTRLVSNPPAGLADGQRIKEQST